MRVSAETKEATRRRILAAARAMFARNGFEATTTREISEAAGVAHGTVFNYFPAKEAIANAIAADALSQAHRQFEKDRRRRSGESLEEELFALIASELRGLRPHRNYLAPVLETALSPLAAGTERDVLREAHMGQVERLLGARQSNEPLSFVAMHLYWTLYTGVLAFWTKDSSRSQEDTLAVLDCSLKAFIRSIADDEGKAGQSRRRD
jgi:AcrR family transcriptional regulator